MLFSKCDRQCITHCHLLFTPIKQYGKQLSCDIQDTVMLHCTALQHCFERGITFSFAYIFSQVFFFSWHSPWPVSGFHKLPKCIWWGQCLSAWKGLVILSYILAATRSTGAAHILSNCFPDAWWFMRGQLPETKPGLTVFPHLSKPVNSAKSHWKSP